MRLLSGKELCRILERKGWNLRRVSGSHYIYSKAESVVRISIPVHGNRPLKKGLLMSFLKAAELSDEDIG